MRPRAIAVKPLDDFKLLVTFSNNENRVFDVKPYFDFISFKELQKLALFETVHISGLSVEWQNGVDICPDELYYDSVLREDPPPD
jgi:hypothetical protein